MTAPPQGVEVDHVSFPAGQIRFYRAGSSGPAVVLLHGGGLDNAMLSWRHTIPVLAADHRVYVPDLPGQGDSLSWQGRTNQRAFEEILRWLFDTWELEAATLVGISMGASIATGFALRHPQRVTGLVLTDSGGLQDRLDKHAWYYALKRSGLLGPLSTFGAKVLGRSRALVRRLLTRHLFTGEQAVTDLDEIVEEVRAEARRRKSLVTDWQADAIDRKRLTVNHMPRLGSITCRTMFIHGAKDPVVPVARSREAAGAVPDGSLRIVDDAGHWPNREKPNEFNSLVREFVNDR